MTAVTSKDVQRFWAKVPVGDLGCWEWRGTPSQRYGSFRLSRPRRQVRAHRLAYEFAFGHIPDGLDVLHRCDNPRCVRPNHLFLGTDQDNVRDAVNKGRWPQGFRNVVVCQHCGLRYPAGQNRCPDCRRAYMRRREQGRKRCRS